MNEIIIYQNIGIAGADRRGRVLKALVTHQVKLRRNKAKLKSEVIAQSTTRGLLIELG